MKVLERPLNVELQPRCAGSPNTEIAAWLPLSPSICYTLRVLSGLGALMMQLMLS
jgi:hypothetical protein